MVVFVACLIEFLMTPQAATSVFFFILTVALIIGLVVANEYTHGRVSLRPQGARQW